MRSQGSDLCAGLVDEGSDLACEGVEGLHGVGGRRAPPALPPALCQALVLTTAGWRRERE